MKSRAEVEATLLLMGFAADDKLDKYTWWRHHTHHDGGVFVDHDAFVFVGEGMQRMIGLSTPADPKYKTTMDKFVSLWEVYLEKQSRD